MTPVPGVPLGFGRQSSSPEPASCPCGGGAYGSCCGPLIAGEQLAITAEQLMRSRYSAFALAASDPKAILISKKTPQNAGAALGMVGSPLQLSGAADAVSSN